MKPILIDARFYGTRHTGIGRYTQNLISHFPPDSSQSIALIVNSKDQNRSELAQFQKYVLDDHPYDLLSQFKILKILFHCQPKLLHTPHFTAPVFWQGRQVVTIHDLIKHESVGLTTTTKPTPIYWFKYFLYLVGTKYIISKASHIIVPSYYWQDKLIKKFNKSTTEVTVTYEGVEELFFNPQKVQQKILKPYIFYVGNVYPHKNVETLIHACKILNGKVHLYISCARDAFWERTQNLITKYKVQNYVTHLGFTPDSQLAALYHSALAFVTASKIEGLGLPGLEAMAASTAVISSNSSCLPEIYGDAALYFDPQDAQQLANHIQLLIKNPHKRKQLILKGSKRVKLFSWTKMAKQTWEIYQKYL